ncbi:MAG: EVE domain-containing protein [Bdellovibrionaceae bacterium]|nr:EVE domain-containing protein [Pseudobdellovibrionaceae bacterium]
MATKKNYWLMKSEPETFSIDDLSRDQSTLWEGVRNYQARNFMMKDMKVGDEVLFYHSNAQPPGVVGIAKISKKAQPDPSCYDKKSPYFDKKSTKQIPRWFCVEVSFKQKFPELISLDEIKQEPQLKDMLVVKKGQRLSIQPVAENDFLYLLEMASVKMARE